MPQHRTGWRRAKVAGMRPGREGFAMDMRHVSLRLLVLVVLGSLRLAAMGAEAPREISGGEKALAVRFLDLSQSMLRGGTAVPDENQFRRIAALLAAARQCDPSEWRYPRLQADVFMHIHDTDGTIEALGSVRRLRPEDRIAQIETIDTFLTRMETADARLAYLQNLLSLEVVPAEIRSYAALQVAAIQEERSRRNDAVEAIDRAIKLNPLNFAALQAKFEHTAKTVGPVQRVGMLVAMVRANPAQPAVLNLLGRHLADAGMTNESLTWFNYAVTVGLPTRTLTLEMMADFATASFLSDRLDDAQKAFDMILKVSPGDYSSLIVRSLIETRRDNPEPARDFRVQAHNALINRLNTIRAQMGIPGATTRPIDQGEIFMPEIGGDTDLFRKQDKAEVKVAYLQSVADLAWFLVFFHEKPDEAQRLMQHLESLMDAKEVAAASFLPRMAGWIYLKQGKMDEAKVKFTAVAEREPMAALGLIKCYAPANKDKARADAQKLVNANPAGVPGAVLLDRVREFGVRAQPSASAPAMVAALSALPVNWMNVLQKPEEFYAIRGQPLKISSPFGEPLVAQVVIQNTSSVDLSVGVDGLIKPGIWFDAQVGGIFQQNIPAVAYERISDAIVLKPRQSINLNVRVDQGDLLRLLQQQPAAPVGFKIIARTNPLFGNGMVVSGPGGYFIELAKVFERSAYPLNADSIQSLAKDAVTADARERVRQLQLLGTIATFVGTQPNPATKSLLTDIQDVLRKARDQADPVVRAWAMFVYAQAAPEQERVPAVQRMFAAEESWQSRMLGLFAMESCGMPVDRQKALIEQTLAKDDAKCVKDFAKVALKILTQPQTRPAEPTGGARPTPDK